MAKIYVCSGSERPRTVIEVFHTQMGNIEWDKRLNISIPIRQAGIAQWLVFVEGLDVRAVKLATPAILHEGQDIDANISRNKMPKIIGV